MVLLADDPERKARTMEAARKAYDTILRLKTSFSMTVANTQKLTHNLSRWKQEVKNWGRVSRRIYLYKKGRAESDFIAGLARGFRQYPPSAGQIFFRIHFPSMYSIRMPHRSAPQGW